MKAMMHADNARRAHEQFGIFRYSDELVRQGIPSPAEQVAIIVWFVHYDLAKANSVPEASAEEDHLNGWMHEKLARTLEHLQHSGGTDHALRIASEHRDWADLWHLNRDFAELFNYRCGPAAYSQATGKLRSRGFLVDWPAIHDLAGQFVLVRLPRAMRSFDPLKGKGHEEAWLASVFYRFALQALLSDRTNRDDLEALQHVASDTPSPSELLEREPEAAALIALPKALEQLPPQEHKAVTLYFGLEGAEQTLAEIATQLGVSEYLARTAVVHGLAKLSALLGIQGRIQSEEFELLHHIFVEGMDLASAAVRMNLSSRRARQMVARVGQKFRESLRPRTTPRHFDINRSGKEVTTMSVGHQLKVDKDGIVAALRVLKETPPLRRDMEGKLEAQLNGDWLQVSQIREIALQDDVAPSLDESNIPVGWLFVPEPSHTPLLEEQVKWLEELQEVRTRSWTSAQLLWQYLSEEFPKHSEIFATSEDETPGEQREDPVALIHSVLGSASHAIESRLPRELRRKNRSRFRINRQENGDARGVWVGDPASVQFDLAKLLRSRGRLLGDFTEYGYEALSRIFVRELFKSEITLPGFNRAHESTEKTVWLDLQARSFNANRHEVSVDDLALSGAGSD